VKQYPVASTEYPVQFSVLSELVVVFFQVVNAYLDFLTADENRSFASLRMTIHIGR
jgi:hypothetical protein